MREQAAKESGIFFWQWDIIGSGPRGYIKKAEVYNMRSGLSETMNIAAAPAFANWRASKCRVAT